MLACLWVYDLFILFLCIIRHQDCITMEPNFISVINFDCGSKMLPRSQKCTFKLWRNSNKNSWLSVSPLLRLFLLLHFQHVLISISHPGLSPFGSLPSTAIQTREVWRYPQVEATQSELRGLPSQDHQSHWRRVSCCCQGNALNVSVLIYYFVAHWRMHCCPYYHYCGITKLLWFE